MMMMMISDWTRTLTEFEDGFRFVRRGGNAVEGGGRVEVVG